MNEEFCYQEKKKDVGGWRMRGMYVQGGLGDSSGNSIPEEWAASLQILRDLIVFFVFLFFIYIYKGWETPLAMQYQRSGQLVCKF